MERGAFEEAAITARHRLFSPIEAELLASVRIEDTYIAVIGGFVNDRSGNYAIVALKVSADPTDTTPAVLYQSPPASYSPDTTYRMYQFTPHVPDAEPFSMAVHIHDPNAPILVNDTPGEGVEFADLDALRKWQDSRAPSRQPRQQEQSGEYTLPPTISPTYVGYTHVTTLLSNLFNSDEFIRKFNQQFK